MVRSFSLGGLRWSEGDVRRLRALAGRGCALHEVAQKLGRSHYAILWQADRYGIAIRREQQGSPFQTNRGAGIDRAIV